MLLSWCGEKSLESVQEEVVREPRLESLSQTRVLRLFMETRMTRFLLHFFPKRMTLSSTTTTWTRTCLFTLQLKKCLQDQWILCHFEQNKQSSYSKLTPEDEAMNLKRGSRASIVKMPLLVIELSGLLSGNDETIPLFMRRSEKLQWMNWEKISLESQEQDQSDSLDKYRMMTWRSKETFASRFLSSSSSLSGKEPFYVCLSWHDSLPSSLVLCSRVSSFSEPEESLDRWCWLDD